MRFWGLKTSSTRVRVSGHSSADFAAFCSYFVHLLRPHGSYLGKAKGKSAFFIVFFFFMKKQVQILRYFDSTPHTQQRILSDQKG